MMGAAFEMTGFVKYINEDEFLGAFAKNAKSDYWLCHVCLFVCPYVWNNSTLTGRIFTKFGI